MLPADPISILAMIGFMTALYLIVTGIYSGALILADFARGIKKSKAAEPKRLEDLASIKHRPSVGGIWLSDTIQKARVEAETEPPTGELGAAYRAGLREGQVKENRRQSAELEELRRWKVGQDGAARLREMNERGAKQITDHVQGSEPKHRVRDIQVKEAPGIGYHVTVEFTDSRRVTYPVLDPKAGAVFIGRLLADMGSKLERERKCTAAPAAKPDACPWTYLGTPTTPEALHVHPLAKVVNINARNHSVEARSALLNEAMALGIAFEQTDCHDPTDDLPEVGLARAAFIHDHAVSRAWLTGGGEGQGRDGLPVVTELANHRIWFPDPVPPAQPLADLPPKTSGAVRWRKWAARMVEQVQRQGIRNGYTDFASDKLLGDFSRRARAIDQQPAP